MAFQNKVVIVTGSSSGIGAAIAIKLSKEQAKLVMVGRNENKLKCVADICEQNGCKPLVVNADVTKDNEIREIIRQSVEHYGKLDVLINNVGTFKLASILDPNAMQDFDYVMATNLRSCVNLTHLAAPYLIETKGNIVNVSSSASTRIFYPENFSYCTSKAGLDHFSKCVALELAPKNVRVNCVNPGPVKTDFVENITLNKDEQNTFWKSLEDTTALGKISAPEEIADLVLYLASDTSKSITGSSFVIDNGNLLK